MFPFAAWGSFFSTVLLDLHASSDDNDDDDDDENFRLAIHVEHMGMEVREWASLASKPRPMTSSKGVSPNPSSCRKVVATNVIAFTSEFMLVQIFRVFSPLLSSWSRKKDDTENKTKIISRMYQNSKETINACFECIVLFGKYHFRF